MSIGKNEEAVNALILKCCEEGITHREIQFRLINPLYKRMGNAEITRCRPEKYDYPTIAEKARAGEGASKEAAEWAEKMFPRITYDEGGKKYIRTESEITFTITSCPLDDIKFNENA